MPLLQDALGLILFAYFVALVRQVRRLSWREVKASTGDYFFGLVKNLPPVQKELKVRLQHIRTTHLPSRTAPELHFLVCFVAYNALRMQKEADKLEADLEHSLRPDGWVDPIKVLPSKGRPVKDIVEQLKGFTAKEEAKVRAHAGRR